MHHYSHSGERNRCWAAFTNFHSLPAILFVLLRPSCLFSSSFLPLHHCEVQKPLQARSLVQLWTAASYLLAQLVCVSRARLIQIRCMFMLHVCLFTHLHTRIQKKTVQCWFAFSCCCRFCQSQTWSDRFDSDPTGPERTWFACLSWKTVSGSCMEACVWCLRVWMTYAFSRLASRDVFCTNRLDARLKSSSAHSCNRSKWRIVGTKLSGTALSSD